MIIDARRCTFRVITNLGQISVCKWYETFRRQCISKSSIWQRLTRKQRLADRKTRNESEIRSIGYLGNYVRWRSGRAREANRRKGTIGNEVACVLAHFDFLLSCSSVSYDEALLTPGTFYYYLHRLVARSILDSLSSFRARLSDTISWFEPRISQKPGERKVEQRKSRKRLAICDSSAKNSIDCALAERGKCEVEWGYLGQPLRIQCRTRASWIVAYMGERCY